MSELDEYADALDHIMRVARASRTDTRRLRWIAGRAECALEGGDWKELDVPVMTDAHKQSLEMQKKSKRMAKLHQRIEDLEELNKKLVRDLDECQRAHDKLAGISNE